MKRNLFVVSLLVISILITAGSFTNVTLTQESASQATETVVQQEFVRWSLSVTPTSANIAQGQSTTFTVDIIGSSGTANIQLIYSPPVLGITVSFSVNNKPAPYTSIMTVKVDSSKPTGDYTVEVWGHVTTNPFPNPIDKYQNVKITVVSALPPPPTPIGPWYLTVTPSSGTVVQGGVATFTVSITGTSGGKKVQLIYSPPVIGITASFSFNNQPAPYTSTMIVNVDSSKPTGSYSIAVCGNLEGYPFPGPQTKYQYVNVIVTPPPQSVTDWELTNPFTDPANPKPGDAVSFGATLKALSTDSSFPQTVMIEVLGPSIVDSFSVSYPGPVGSTLTIKTTKTWNLAAGNYTVFIIADSPPPYHYKDPNRANNQATKWLTITEEYGTWTVATTGYWPSNFPKCLIATATYGSELSPEVQLLRDFRDRSILQTKAGSNFMIAFNAWYYSFSPYVANYLSQHWVERGIMKGVLYPLIGILSLSSRVYTSAQTFPEIAVLLSGLLASTLIGTFYLGIPISLLRASIRRLSGRRIQRLLERGLGVALFVGLCGILAGETLNSSPLLMVSTSLTVLATLALSAAMTSSIISKQTTRFFRG